MRRAEDGQAGDFAAIHQFAGDQTGLDGLADTHVVGNQQAHGGQAQRHQQRHGLVAARLHGNIAEGAERAGSGAQGQTQGVAQQQCGGVVACTHGVGPGKGGGLDGVQFQLGNQGNAFVISATQWTQAQPVAARIALHHPFAATGAHQVAGQEVVFEGCHAPLFLGTEHIGVRGELL